MNWWVRPLVRVLAALSLPFVVPLVVIPILWALPGNPVTILCPLCNEDEIAPLIERWNLQSPMSFYWAWLKEAFVGNFGEASDGQDVTAILWESLPSTGLVILIALLPTMVGMTLVALGKMSPKLDPLWQFLGAPPAVILSLISVASIVLTFGPVQVDTWLLRIVVAGLILGVADGLLAAAIVGSRSTFETEIKQRYVGIAVLRGESVLSNTLPNILPALVGQFRGRLLHMLSGAVIVEVVLEVNGLGDLLFRATLQQDFMVVMATTWGLSVLAGAFLLVQGVVDIAVARHIRRAPKVML